ncbi:MAG TPA: hypothetical protein PLD25_18935 [Chloroflexota bacterium]|nr:hypothetical protein [Chloroflexota bacterium]HUM67819.1 hypothetical protein [Chloroflexota bacterium]
MIPNIAGTITPWILGTLFVLMILALAIVVKSWREVKSSPYYFMRRQAEKRLQTYSFASLCLVLATAVTAAATLQKPHDQTVLVAILTNTKPASSEIKALIEAAPNITAVTGDDLARQSISTAVQSFDESNAALLQTVLTLPQEYDQVQPTVELNDNTFLTSLVFSTKIDDDYKAIDPTNIFSVGRYTLFATFDYDGMANGMAWSWVWRHEGEVVEGGNELWNYGKDGPGYIYLNPEEGFRAGKYSLEVWVNGELFTRADITMTGSALSAGN